MQPMYYIGLDVHKRTISYCVKDGSGTILIVLPARKRIEVGCRRQEARQRYKIGKHSVASLRPPPNTRHRLNGSPCPRRRRTARGMHQASSKCWIARRTISRRASSSVYVVPPIVTLELTADFIEANSRATLGFFIAIKTRCVDRPSSR